MIQFKRAPAPLTHHDTVFVARFLYDDRLQQWACIDIIGPFFKCLHHRRVNHAIAGIKLGARLIRIRLNAVDVQMDNLLSGRFETIKEFSGVHTRIRAAKGYSVIEKAASLEGGLNLDSNISVGGSIA